MAATDDQRVSLRMLRAERGSAGGAVGSVLVAALALPGVAGVQPAHAQSQPESTTTSLRVLRYREAQPGLDRVRVNSPSFHVLTPIGDVWSLEAGLVSDSVSGASPRYHTAVSGASRMTDERRAGDVKVTRYFSRTSLSAGMAVSTEHDYRSRAASLEGTWSSEDKNTTLHLGLGGSNDRIDPVNQAVVDESRRTGQVSVGVTQVPTRADLVQATLGHSRGRGYFSDPYKQLDVRPRSRDLTTLLLRWNHHFAGNGSTLRTSYRAYGDTFGVRAHAVQADWTWPATSTLHLSPGVRVYAQTAADFYADPVYDPLLGAPYPVGYDRAKPPQFLSLDQRLSAFGAVTLGLGARYSVDTQWSIDGRVEVYEQRARWALSGRGSPGLEPLRATSLQLGVQHRF